jgi:ribonuclease HI
MKAVIHTDGACFGNPGPMGLGILIELENGKTIEKSIPFGHGTNNIAEYSALLKAIEIVRQEQDVTHIQAFLDSNLVVQQLLGNWRIKDDKLRTIADAIKALVQNFESFVVEHIPREENGRADELSKIAAQSN